MKKHFLFILLLSDLFFLLSCQKEFSFENSKELSVGSLTSDVSGACLPKTVNGIYEAGTALDATTNYIDVQVDVTKVGSYSVFTDTVSGISFKGTGNFANLGLNTVRLAGTGTPVNSGIKNFQVSYNSTSCAVTLSVLPPGGATPAVFTLAGGPDTCMNYVLAGNYAVDTPMTAANSVTVKVNVTTAGTYSISTTQNNGISFSGVGVLSATGAQTITLMASGTPAQAVSTTMLLTAGNSTCSFVVDVSGGFDYFPRTANNNWSYQYDGVADDSLLIRAKPGIVNMGGNTYTVFEATKNAATGFEDIGAYRKSGSDYHTYVDLGSYFGIGGPQNIDYIFLKDNLPANTSWQTAPINGTFTDTTGTIFPISLRIAFTIEKKDVTVTVGSVSYPNTIVVIEKYELYDGANWQDVTDLIGYFKSYYARDVGLIKMDSYYEDGNLDPPIEYQQDIRRYQVF